MNKLYLTRVICYKTIYDKKCKCDVSTIPVEGIEASNGNTIYKSLVSPEIIGIPSNVYLYRKVKFYPKQVFYFCLTEDDNLDHANKQSLEMIKNHFDSHKFFLKCLYKKFIDVLKNYFYR
jgi:hypothetical protein